MNGNKKIVITGTNNVENNILTSFKYELVDGVFNWVACDDRNPDEFGDYLVTLKNGVIKILGYSPVQTSWYPKGFFYTTDTGFNWKQNHGNPVVAWTDLPNPYYKPELN